MNDKEHIGKLLKITNQIFDTYINNSLKDINLTNSQATIMMYICYNYKHNIDTNQTNIQDKFNLSNPTVTGILNRLEDKLFISRVKNGRNNIIIPTDKSLLMMKSSKNKVEEIENKILNNLSKEEINNLVSILSKIINSNKIGVDIND